MTSQSSDETRTKNKGTYLFMGVAQLVLQDGFAINQRLNFVCKGGEGLCQSLDEDCGRHPMGHEGRCRICKLLLGITEKEELGGKWLVWKRENSRASFLNHPAESTFSDQALNVWPIPWLGGATVSVVQGSGDQVWSQLQSAAEHNLDADGACGCT